MMAKVGQLETQIAAGKGAKVPTESSDKALQDMYGLITRITAEPAVGKICPV